MQVGHVSVLRPEPCRVCDGHPVLEIEGKAMWFKCDLCGYRGESAPTLREAEERWNRRP